MRGNPNNMRPFRDSATAREKGAIGGVKSGKARRDKRDLKTALELLLSLPDEDGTGSNLEAVAVALLKKAKNGDTRAFEALRDSVYGRPTVRAEVTETPRCKLVLFSDEQVPDFPDGAATGEGDAGSD